MAEQNTPYIDTSYNSRIELLPAQMNNDIYINLKSNLIKQKENKCNKDGYIVKIYKIVKYDNGYCEPENLSGSAFFDISFNCRICIPIVGTKLTCKLTEINRALISACNGPILIMIRNNDLNNDNFTYGSDGIIKHNATDKYISVNDIVVVTIIAKKFHINDTIIKVIGYLDNMASSAEIAQYNNEVYTTEESKQDIEFI